MAELINSRRKEMTTEADFQPHRPITEEQQAILDQILQSGSADLKASDEWRAAHAPQPEPEAAP